MSKFKELEVEVSFISNCFELVVSYFSVWRGGKKLHARARIFYLCIRNKRIIIISLNV